jgi:hypothetical protein
MSVTTPVDIAEPPNPALILADFRAFERSLALRTAIELDLFTLVEAGHDTPATLAVAAGASERGVRILCDFLTVSGHLTKQSTRYGLTPASHRYLTSGSPAFIGSGVRFIASDGNLRSFSRLAAAVKNGGAEPEARTVPDAATWVGFARFMASISKPIADAAANVLELDPRAPMQVLDIAAGHGIYGLAIAARCPLAHVFALDHAEVLAVASENAVRAGVSERFHLMPGDAFHAAFGGPYDLILVPNFAHHFDRETNVGFFAKCHAALKAAGRLALVEFIPNDDRVSPPPDAAFALTMLATTEKGDAYTCREFADMLTRAGFRHVRQPDLGQLPRWVITASA